MLHPPVIGRGTPFTSRLPIVACYTWCRCQPQYNFFFFLFFFLFNHHFHFPAHLVVGFTLSDVLDKPWSRVSSLLPPGTCLQFLSRIGFSIPTARRFSSNVVNSRSRAFPLIIIFFARKSPYEYVHSVRIELAKLILVGTRITYQATADAGCAYYMPGTISTK